MSSKSSSWNLFILETLILSITYTLASASTFTIYGKYFEKTTIQNEIRNFAKLFWPAVSSLETTNRNALLNFFGFYFSGAGMLHQKNEKDVDKEIQQKNKYNKPIEDKIIYFFMFSMIILICLISIYYYITFRSKNTNLGSTSDRLGLLFLEIICLFGGIIVLQRVYMYFIGNRFYSLKLKKIFIKVLNLVNKIAKT